MRQLQRELEQSQLEGRGRERALAEEAAEARSGARRAEAAARGRAQQAREALTHIRNKDDPRLRALFVGGHEDCPHFMGGSLRSGTDGDCCLGVTHPRASSFVKYTRATSFVNGED